MGSKTNNNILTIQNNLKVEEFYERDFLNSYECDVYNCDIEQLSNVVYKLGLKNYRTNCFYIDKEGIPKFFKVEYRVEPWKRDEGLTLLNPEFRNVTGIIEINHYYSIQIPTSFNKKIIWIKKERGYSTCLTKDFIFDSSFRFTDFYKTYKYKGSINKVHNIFVNYNYHPIQLIINEKEETIYTRCIDTNLEIAPLVAKYANVIKLSKYNYKLKKAFPEFCPVDN